MSLYNGDQVGRGAKINYEKLKFAIVLLKNLLNAIWNRLICLPCTYYRDTNGYVKNLFIYSSEW